MFLRVDMPKSIACQDLLLIALSLEQMTSLVMHSTLTLISDINSTVGGMTVNAQFCLLPESHSASCPQAVGGARGS